MRNYGLIFGMGLMLTPFLASAQSAVFFESIQDVPLMPGLVEYAEDGLNFDKPGGRIVESVADMTNHSPQDVRAYYDATLPQFGWRQAGRDQFVRQDEVLELGFEKTPNFEILRVMIRPR